MSKVRIIGALLVVAGCTFGEEPERRIITGDEVSTTGFGPEASLFDRDSYIADDPPPPVSGGSLAFDGERIVVGDPIRDRIYIATVEDNAIQVRHEISAGRDAEPGRVLLRGDRADVILRGSGEIAQVDVSSGEIVRRTEICGAPRGIDAMPEGGLVTACVDGDLVFLTDDLEIERRQRLEPDLRDVVAQGDKLFVSTYRAAKVIELRGTSQNIHELPRLTVSPHQPRVAWRMRAAPDGEGVMVLHEQMSETDFTGVPVAYYGSAFTPAGSRIVQTGVALIRGDEEEPVLTTVDGAAMAVDFVPGDATVAVATAFMRSTFNDPMPGVYTSPLYMRNGSMGTASPITHSSGWTSPVSSIEAGDDGSLVAYSERDGKLVYWGNQYGAPNSVVTLGDQDEIEANWDVGHDLFHAYTPAQVTCAGCHPGARDDAYVWLFSGQQRRTQSLRGGILSTAPYHWTGDHSDMSEIMYRSFDTRMNGPDLTYEQADAVGSWLDTLPALRVKPTDMAAVERGEDIYADQNCASCHDASVPPGDTMMAGSIMLAPTLDGLGARGPYFHDGCAEDLEEAMSGTSGPGACGGAHPRVGADQLEDLAAYLEQL